MDIVRGWIAEAIAAWSDACPVDFVEVENGWDFEVVMLREDDCDKYGCTLASAFFPDAGRHALNLYPRLLKLTDEERVETLVHELGHVFGLRHFFAPESEVAWPSEIFGTDSPFSIMNYGERSELTDADRADLERLYANVWNGTLTQINGTPIVQQRPYHHSAPLRSPASSRRDVEGRAQATQARWKRRAKKRSDSLVSRTPRGPLGINVRTLNSRAAIAKRLIDISRITTAASSPEGFAASGAPLSIDALERIIAEDEKLGSRYLIDGARILNTIGRVVIRDRRERVLGYGTGFLVAERVLMTNNHVLEVASEATNSLVEFDFYRRQSGSSQPVVTYRLRPSDLFWTDEALDCTVVAVEAMSLSRQESIASRGHLQLDGGTEPLVGERLNIVQHPSGRAQEVSFRDNRLVDVLDDFFHYTSDTERGSSGSPVFDDLWRLVALHHSGVPRRDGAGNILLDDGKRWDGRKSTVPRIAWVANEGVRMQSIVGALKRAKIVRGAELLPDLVGPPPTVRPEMSNGPTKRGLSVEITIAGETVISETVPLVLAGASGPAAPVPPGARYYDTQADAEAKLLYWDGIDSSVRPGQLFRDLRTHLARTHQPLNSYRDARHRYLYPIVDLHPDGRLRSIYSGRPFEVHEIVGADEAIDRARSEILQEAVLREASTEEIGDLMGAFEQSHPYNCEHVVPQSWFGRSEPARSDLHHLFTCEGPCNSFRSNIPYGSFEPTEEADREGCGRREQGRFEPEHGHGPVARATMYFLLRYPGEIGDAPRELQASRLNLLRRWSKEDPPGRWERHRNATIFAAQGNRNPLIDFPEWVDKIDFTLGFG